MNKQEALAKILDYCARQERCRNEVIQKLQSWEVSEAIIEEIVILLVQERFLDELRYASYFTKDKFRLNGWGRIKIGYALRQKGVANLVIQQAFDEIDSQEYEQKLSTLVAQKWRSGKGGNVWQNKASVARFLLSRGFESDLVWSAIEKYNVEEAE